jgi:malate dehydrogenase (oxaloacetate-decarboxylating)(NADP+)
VDRGGLVVAGRSDLAGHKRRYAHGHEGAPDLRSAVDALRPTVLIGLSTQGQSFTEPILRALAAHHERPIIFALSNPTSRAECTAQQAYEWTDGRGVFASGSPFDPVQVAGHRFQPRQANNAYIFPGLGMGVVVSAARRVTDAMFLAAADALAASLPDQDLAHGCVLPALERIRDVSLVVAAAVARIAVRDGLAAVPLPDDPTPVIAAAMYRPEYRSYV